MANEQQQALASIYAEALFELAQEPKQTDVLQAEFAKLVEVIESTDSFALFLHSPAISSDAKKETLAKVLKGRVSDLFMDFLMVVADKDRLNVLVAMYETFEALIDRHAGRVKGVLTTAFALSEKEIAKLSKEISQKLNKTVSLEAKVDPAIIGGMILNIDETIVDGSVRRRLQLLDRKLKLTGAEQLRNTEAYIH